MRSILELKERIGHSLKPGPWYVVDQQRINQFAEVTEDRQYIHIDENRAKQSSLGGTIAHGFLLLSLLPKLAEQCMLLPENLVMGINYGFDKVRFLSPVRPGDRVRVCAVVADVQEKEANRYILKLDIRLEIEGRAKPALFCEWLNLFVYE